MEEVTAHHAARNFGKLVSLAKDDPVIIKRYGRTAAVLMSGVQFRFYNELLDRVTCAEIQDAVRTAATACVKDEDRAIRALNKVLCPLRPR